MTHYSRTPLRSNRPSQRPTLPSWALGLLVIVFLLATALAGYLVFATVRDVVAGWSITHATGPHPTTNNQTPGVTPAPGNSVGSLVPKKWAGTDRVTILVMGIDRRKGEAEKGYLTDTLMLVTVDPVAQTAGMLSVPRDLWVEVPGYGVDTINTANRTGDYYSYPGGGPALALKTVQHNLGVTVNYYVRLDFTAFETLIDAIGGIDVEVAEDIADPQYPDGSYGYEPFYLSAGPQHLNGHDALRYARTRHDSSDIDRARRQQQVVMAVRNKILNLKMLPKLITQAPALYQTLNESVQTDLSLDQIISLALLAQDIPTENIRSEVIDFHYVLDYTTPEGRQVLVPLRDKIRELRDSMFSTSTPLLPPTQINSQVLIPAEAAKVVVLNGSGVTGLAQATSEWLTGQGLNVVSFDTADRSDYATSVIVDYTGKPYTTRWLATTFHVTNIISGSDPSSPVDIKLILGADWNIPDSTATP
jgi:LCP family protein required for cell wall assembly